MALPRMLLAADISGSIQKAPQAGGKKIKGVNEYYAACFLRPRETPSTEGGVSAPSLAGLLPVRPVELSDKGLIVEPL